MTKDEMKAALAAMAEGEDPEAAECAKAALAAFEPAPAEEAPAAATAPAAASISTVDLKLAARVDAQAKEIAELRADRANEKRSALFASRPDISDALKAELKDEDPARIEKLFAGIAKPSAAPAAEQNAAVNATRGNSSVRATRLPPEQKAALDVEMGLSTVKRGVVNDGPYLRLGVMKPGSN